MSDLRQFPPAPPPGDGDPGSGPAPEDAVDGMEEHRFPCTTCGSDMRFDPQAMQMVCDHCGNTEPLDESRDVPVIRELDFEAAIRDQLAASEMEETRVLQCPNCGAQVEFSPDVHAAECPFCATPVVTDTGTHRHIKPRGLLPFALTEPQARAAMTDWLGRLWLAPNGLQDYARKGRRMSGIYVPFWTIDAQTRTAYRGQRGTVYYVTQTVVRNGQRQTVRVPRVRWRHVSGRVQRFFDDVLILAATSLPKSYTDNLAPWQLSALEPYTPEYLAGFRAEGYTVGLEAAFVEARQVMDAQIRRDIRFDIGGDRQRIDAVDTDVGDVTFKHILLPVWVAAYKYQGKSYRFVVNGQSGKVQGERPYSPWKVAVAVILGILVAGVLGYLYAMAETGGF